MAPPSWVYFRDTAAPRALYFSDDLSDGSPDSYSPLGQSAGSTPEMTVFGFGRRGLKKFMNAVPAQFSVGLCEALDHAAAERAVHCCYQPLVIRVGRAAARPSSGK